METKRGRVLRDTNVGAGLVTVDGRQYSFTLENMWVSEIPPRAGMVVDVNFASEGNPVSLRAVPEKELAKEHAQQALAGARRHSEALTSRLHLSFGLPVIVAEVLLLGSFFLLPALNMGGFRELNGWDAIGIDMSTGISSHGLLSVLALALLAPVAVPFLQRSWAHWLYAAPVVFCLFAFGTVFYEVQNAGRAGGRAVSDAFGSTAGAQFGNPLVGMFHPGVGTFAVFLCALYLFFHAVRSGAWKASAI